MTTPMKIILAVVLVIVLACGGLAWYVVSSTSKTVQTAEAALTQAPAVVDASAASEPTPEPGPAEIVQVEAQTTEMPIEDTKKKSQGIRNILLVGTDSRDANNTDVEGRSDTMILASYDMDKNKVTLVSFMRDMEVWRFGEKKKSPTFKGKLNAAYTSGGVGELINTLNAEKNFGLDIQDYVSVGFSGFWMLIDAVDGIEVNLTKDEAYFINWRAADLYKNDDKKDRLARLEKLGKTALEEVDGVQTLHGEQALWYCRDRYTETFGGASSDDEGGNSDTGRINRQQYLFKLVYEKATSNYDFMSLLAMYRAASPYISTNLSFEDLIAIATKIYNEKPEIVSIRVPFDGTYTTKKTQVNETTGEEETVEGIYVKDFKSLQKQLHEMLYGAAAVDPNEDADDSDN